MPFMIGKEPIRRTLKYLESGSMHLKSTIQIMALCYTTHGTHGEGFRDFLFWRLPQIQYKNPKVQVMTIRNKTPTPFIWCFYNNGKRMLIDCHNKSHEEIMDHCKKVICKTEEVLAQEVIMSAKKENPANFGFMCDKSCICMLPGQVPCPAIVPLPYHMRAKYWYMKNDIPEHRPLWTRMKEK